MIPFNVPPNLGSELEYVGQAIHNKKLSGDGEFTYKCSELMQNRYNAKKVLMTTSCTHALEMSAMLTGIKPGDEVIMPSYTFVSTANAFVLRGAKIRFVDIRKDTMNIDEKLIEQAITKRTKAIVPVHYAGIACEMDTINDIAKAHNIKVIEDAAQAVQAFYKGKALGTLGDFGCYSFHETKNYSMGEGGALVIRNEEDIARAEIIREKGTDRSKFFRGEIDKYTWVDYGSSYLPSEINVAYLYSQLLDPYVILDNRLEAWHYYHYALEKLEVQGKLERPIVPLRCKHNGHMYAIKVKDIEQRTAFINYLREKDILAVFHYVPLHSSKYGKKCGTFIGEDNYTTRESERLVRLPLYYGLEKSDQDKILECIEEFFNRV